MNEIRVKTGQVELQLREYEGNGDTIIFLHFSGANLMMWQRAIPYFRDHYQLILVDLRGHGQSDKPQSGYHMDIMAGDVIGIMQHLKLERAHIIGSSLGAEVGLSMAASYPERVSSLVCDGALSSEYGPYSAWEGSEEDYDDHVAQQLEKIRSKAETTYPSVDKLVDNRRETLEKYGLWNEYVEAMVRYGVNKIDEGKYTKDFSQQAMADYMEHYFRTRFEDYYKRIKCPLLMVTNEEGLANELEKVAMEGLSGLANQGTILAIKGWEHPYGWLLDPEGVCRAILSFLNNSTNPIFKEPVVQ